MSKKTLEGRCHILTAASCYHAWCYAIDGFVSEHEEFWYVCLKWIIRDESGRLADRMVGMSSIRSFRPECRLNFSFRESCGVWCGGGLEGGVGG
jgi:hypothetical protein